MKTKKIISLIKKVYKTIQAFIIFVLPCSGWKNFWKAFKKIWGIKNKK